MIFGSDHMFDIDAAENVTDDSESQDLYTALTWSALCFCLLLVIGAVVFVLIRRINKSQSERSGHWAVMPADNHVSNPDWYSTQPTEGVN